MAKVWTPIWKDEVGNRFIFPARNNIFEHEYEAAAKALADAMYMVAWGLSPCPIGPSEIEIDDNGQATLTHYEANFPRLGFAALVGGPSFEERWAKDHPETA